MDLFLTAKIRPKSVQSTRFAGHAYVDAKVKAFKQELSWQLKPQIKGYKFGTCEISMCFYFAKQTETKKVKEQLKNGSIIYYNKTPDLDNLNKGVADVLQALGLFEKGDQNIVKLNLEKRIGLKNKIDIYIKEVTSEIIT